MLLPFPCTSAPVQRLTLSSIYQTASICPAGVPDTPAGLLGDVHSDPARFFSSPRPSVCGIIPARLIWSWSFISVPAAAAKINQRGFYTQSEALLELLHLSSPFPFIRTWPARWRCDYTRFSPLSLLFQSTVKRTDALS